MESTNDTGGSALPALQDLCSLISPCKRLKLGPPVGLESSERESRDQDSDHADAMNSLLKSMETPTTELTVTNSGDIDNVEEESKTSNIEIPENDFQQFACTDNDKAALVDEEIVASDFDRTIETDYDKTTSQINKTSNISEGCMHSQNEEGSQKCFENDLIKADKNNQNVIEIETAKVEKVRKARWIEVCDELGQIKWVKREQYENSIKAETKDSISPKESNELEHINDTMPSTIEEDALGSCDFIFAQNEDNLCSINSEMCNNQTENINQEMSSTKIFEDVNSSCGKASIDNTLNFDENNELEIKKIPKSCQEMKETPCPHDNESLDCTLNTLELFNQSESFKVSDSLLVNVSSLDKEHISSATIYTNTEQIEKQVDNFNEAIDDESVKQKQTATVQVTDLDATLTNEREENNDDIYDEECPDYANSVVQQRCMEMDTISLNVTNFVSNSVPLCASTPAYGIQTTDCNRHPYSNNPDDTMKNADANQNQYPVLVTFKPHSVKNEEVVRKPDLVSGNSVPLCTSTPMMKDKPQKGLQLRDMNIAKDHNKDIFKDVKNHCNGRLIKNNQENEMKVLEHSSEQAKNEINLRESKKSVENAQKGTLKRDRDSKREKRKIKGTRIEKFKEYMGPGLTSNVNTDNDQAINAENKDFVKNTDIQTCTLTEYKGFGLTGPLPDKPLMASTPLPPKGLTIRNPNIINNDKEMRNNKPSDIKHYPSIIESKSSLQGHLIAPANSMVKSLSGSSLGQRPAGTEGLILSNYGPFPSTGTLPKEKHSVAGVSQNITPFQIYNQQKETGSTTNDKNKVWFQTDKAPIPSMIGQSSHFNSGSSLALQPDEAYPSLTCSKKDKSDNNSNADRSDKSDKSEKMFDPKVLQCPGQLKVSAYMNFGLLTVHVVQGRQLTTKWKSTCDSFVKMSLIPDDSKKPRCRTDIVQDSNNPLYDEKFSFELNDDDHSKRLMISVWHRDNNASVNEFLGCMSFGLRHLANPKKEVSGWYYLLTEDIGRKKHLQVSHKQKPQLKVRNHSNIPSVNKDLWGTESLQLSLHRGKNGFGFTIVEACPVRVGRVDGASPAETAGLQPGDIIIRLNKQNVSRSTATSVAKLVKHSSNTLVVEIQRPKPVTFEHLENSVWKSNSISEQQSQFESCEYGNNNHDNDHTVPQMFSLHDDIKENEISVDEDTMFPFNSLATSTPLPLLARGHMTVQTREMRKQEGIHRLLSLELDFIDLMHSGMQRYSRPLRHCILSHSHHTALFQNIEKLTTISEYHVKQMHDNAPSSFSEDTDTSAGSDSHNFVHSIGMIYQSKVHMLCQAYDLYAKGVSGANQVLSDLRRSEDFMKFVRDPPLGGNEPSISMFIYRPVQHIRELYSILQEIYLNTTQDSPDYNCLRQVVEGLQECANNITNYSCDRVESMSSLASRDSKMSSLASRDSKTSFTSSMKSQSSCGSSHSGSSKGQGHQPSCSLQSSKSVDTQVMKIQDRLVFSANVPVFQLCQEDRHIIFSGDMFKWEGHQWIKIHVILFTDMLLQTVKESDGYLRVIQEPTMLRDIVGMDAQRQHGTEFVLYCDPRLPSSGSKATRKLNLRAPSTEQKYAWKSLVEQRVFAVRGSLEYYSSTSDVSSGSASAIII